MNVEYSNNSDLVVKIAVQIKLAPPVAVSVGQGCGIRGLRSLDYRRLSSAEFLNNLCCRLESVFRNPSIVCVIILLFLPCIECSLTYSYKHKRTKHINLNLNSSPEVAILLFIIFHCRYLHLYLYKCGPGSSVGIATD